jgi:hypothetical protein
MVAHALRLGRYTEIAGSVRGKFKTYTDGQLSFAYNDIVQTISIMGDSIDPEYATKLDAEMDEILTEMSKRMKGAKK